MNALSQQCPVNKLLVIFFAQSKQLPKIAGEGHTFGRDYIRFEVGRDICDVDILTYV